MNEITLYHGNNGAHEFYETWSPRADGERLLIIRHSPDHPWFVLDAKPALPEGLPVGSLSEVVRAVADRTQRRIAIDPGYEWQDTGNPKSMELLPLDHKDCP